MWVVCTGARRFICLILHFVQIGPFIASNISFLVKLFTNIFVAVLARGWQLLLLGSLNEFIDIGSLYILNRPALNFAASRMRLFWDVVGSRTRYSPRCLLLLSHIAHSLRLCIFQLAICMTPHNLLPRVQILVFIGDIVALDAVCTNAVGNIVHLLKVHWQTAGDIYKNLWTSLKSILLLKTDVMEFYG